MAILHIYITGFTLSTIFLHTVDHINFFSLLCLGRAAGKVGGKRVSDAAQSLEEMTCQIVDEPLSRYWCVLSLRSPFLYVSIFKSPISSKVPRLVLRNLTK